MRWAYARALGRDLIGPADTDTYYARALHDGMRHIAPARGLSGLLPGDLLFYRNGKGVVHHVSMYIGGAKVVQAQKSGTEVGVSTADLGREYAGAIRLLPPGTALAPVLPSPHTAKALPAGLGPGLVRWAHSAWHPAMRPPASQPKPGRRPAAASKPVHTAAPKPRPQPKPKPKPAPVSKPAPDPAPAPTSAPTPSPGLNLLGSGGLLDGVTTTLSGLLGGHPNG